MWIYKEKHLARGHVLAVVDGPHKRQKVFRFANVPGFPDEREVMKDFMEAATRAAPDAVLLGPGEPPAGWVAADSAVDRRVVALERIGSLLETELTEEYIDEHIKSLPEAKEYLKVLAHAISELSYTYDYYLEEDSE